MIAGAGFCISNHNPKMNEKEKSIEHPKSVTASPRVLLQRQTKALVLYFLETRSLTKMEGPQFTLRRQKNSQDSVKIKNPDVIPMRLRRVAAKFDGDLWETIRAALPEDLKRPFDAGMEDSSPYNDGIKREIAAGAEFEGVSVARGYHVRVA